MFEKVKSVLVGEEKAREAPYALKQLLAASEKTQPSAASRRVVEAFPLDVLASACIKADKELFAAEDLAIRAETECAKMVKEAEEACAAITTKATAERDELVKSVTGERDALVAAVEEKKRLLFTAQSKLMRQLIDMNALNRVKDLSALIKPQEGA